MIHYNFRDDEDGSNEAQPGGLVCPDCGLDNCDMPGGDDGLENCYRCGADLETEVDPVPTEQKIPDPAVVACDDCGVFLPEEQMFEEELMSGGYYSLCSACITMRQISRAW